MLAIWLLFHRLERDYQGGYSSVSVRPADRKRFQEVDSGVCAWVDSQSKP